MDAWFTALDNPSSPSIDTEAASQQLLAEASSPVRRAIAVPPAGSVAAQRGATLLNAARALPKLSPAPAGRTGKLRKIGQLQPPVSQQPRRLGKLPRASLAGLVSEDSQKKARGKQMYDIDPSPRKKRRSLPAQIAALEDEDDMVLETSQVQPDDDEPTEIPEGLDVSAPTEAFGDDDIIDVPTSPVVAREDEVPSAAKKQRVRPRKGGDSVLSLAVQEEAEVVGPSRTEPLEGQSTAPSQKRRGRPRKSGGSVASQSSAAGLVEVVPRGQQELSVAPKKRLGRPRKSGESVTSYPSDVIVAEVNDTSRDGVLKEVQEEAQQPAVAAESKREGRPERDIDTPTNDMSDARPRPAKKVKRLKGPKMISPDGPEFEEDVLPPIATPRQDVPQAVQTDARQESREVRRQERRQAAQARDDPQSLVEVPIRSTRLRSTRSQDEPAHAPELSTAPASVPAISRKGKAAPHIAANLRAAVASSATGSTKRKKTNRQIHISFHELNPAAEAGDDIGATDNEQDADLEVDDKRQEDDDEVDKDQKDQEMEKDDEDADDHEHEGGHHPVEGLRLPALEKVFESADKIERSGACTVGLARKIHRACDSARVMISGGSCSYGDIAECKDSIVRRLASIGSRIPEDTRFDFKRDAFAYLFRALTLVLEAMYNKFGQKGREEAVMELLDALQILHPFICEMLRFKDTMDSWKVKVQGRAQGDRLIKDVETGLIAPLRIVEKDFKKRLSALQKVEEARQARLNIQRQYEKQEQEMIRMEESTRSTRERRKHWQDLHIARMQYEPDPYRRRRLRFVEPPATTETDANGNEFERVPFFVERSAPPPSFIPTTRGEEWSPEQDTALLDALQSSTPLEDIFRDHCGPRGALREFSVSDFAAKLAWVRSSWAQLLHLHPDWELPEWVKKIPALP